MLNSVSMKLYKMFASKFIYVVSGVMFVLVGLYGGFGAFIMKNSDEDAVEHFDYYLGEHVLNCHNTSFLLLFLVIVFVVLISAFSSKGYVKNIAGYVQNPIVNLVSDIIIGVIIWFVFIVICNIGFILGVLVIYGGEFSFAGIGGGKILLAKCGVALLSVVAIVLMINIIIAFTKKESAALTISITVLFLGSMIEMFICMAISKVTHVSSSKYYKYCLMNIQDEINKTELGYSLGDYGQIAIAVAVYCIIFGGVLFLIRKKDKI